jgi:hypothetical protein
MVMDSAVLEPTGADIMTKPLFEIPRNYCTTEGPLGAEIRRRQTELLYMRVKRTLDRARSQLADSIGSPTPIGGKAK